MQIVKSIQRTDNGYKVEWVVGENKLEVIEYSFDEFNKQFSLMKQAIMSNGQPVIREDLPTELEIREQVNKLREEMLEKLEEQAKSAKDEWNTIKDSVSDTLDTRGQIWEGLHQQAEKRLVTIAEAVVSTKNVGEKALKDLAGVDARREEVISDLAVKSDITWEMTQRSKEDVDKVKSQVDAYIKDVESILDKIKEEKRATEAKVEKEQTIFRSEIKKAFNDQNKILEDMTVQRQERESERIRIEEEEKKAEIRKNYIEKEVKLRTERDNKILTTINSEVQDLIIILEEEHTLLKETIVAESKAFKTEDGDLAKLMEQNLVDLENEQVAIQKATSKVVGKYKEEEGKTKEQINQILAQAEKDTKLVVEMEAKIEKINKDKSVIQDEIDKVKVARVKLSEIHKAKEKEQIKKAQNSLESTKSTHSKTMLELQEMKDRISKANITINEGTGIIANLNMELQNEKAKPEPKAYKAGPAQINEIKDIVVETKKTNAEIAEHSKEYSVLEKELDKQDADLATVKKIIATIKVERRKVAVEDKRKEAEYEKTKADKIAKVKQAKEEAKNIEKEYREKIRHAKETARKQVQALKKLKKKYRLNGSQSS